MYEIIDKNKNHYLLRKLQNSDYEMLAKYFISLSDETRSRFGPHPLTEEYALELCNQEEDTAFRFVLEKEAESIIVGYFILESQMSIHEKERFARFDVTLESKCDLLFAPSILDGYQNNGLASKVMPVLINEAKQLKAKRLVLMGGTQESNDRAIAFYEKFGFKKYGGYHTEMYNHDMMMEL